MHRGFRKGARDPSPQGVFESFGHSSEKVLATVTCEMLPNDLFLYNQAYFRVVVGGFKDEFLVPRGFTRFTTCIFT